MIKLNDYLVHFLVPDGVTATKISCKEFVDVLEDRIPHQWKLEFKKKGFDSSSSMLKEFLDMCVHLEEAELQKPLRKIKACTKRSMTKTEQGNIKTSPSCVTRDVTVQKTSLRKKKEKDLQLS
eukprot:5573661-Ditylum_brightwellii.AAC.1